MRSPAHTRKDLGPVGDSFLAARDGVIDEPLEWPPAQGSQERAMHSSLVHSLGTGTDAFLVAADFLPSLQRLLASDTREASVHGQAQPTAGQGSGSAGSLMTAAL